MNFRYVSLLFHSIQRSFASHPGGIENPLRILLDGKNRRESPGFRVFMRIGPLTSSSSFFFIFHALYGLRLFLIDLGMMKQEKLLFWVSTLVGIGLFVFSYVLFFLNTMVMPLHAKARLLAD